MGCNITYRVGDDLVGEPQQPLPEPFVEAVVIVGAKDLVKALVRHRKLRVSVAIGADTESYLAVQHALAVAPPDAASTKDLLVHESGRVRTLTALLEHARARVDELLDRELAGLRTAPETPEPSSL